MRTNFDKAFDVTDASTPLRGRKKSKRAATASRDTALRSYMQAMGDYPTFSADEELQAAIELREARCVRWAALLRYPPLVPSIRKLIDERLEVEDSLAIQLLELEQLAESFRLRRTLANEAEFNTACDRIGALLPDIDTDSELAELLVADIERIANNDREGLTVEVSRMPGDSRPFRNYRRSSESSQRRVRRLTNAFAKANLRLVVSLARRLSHGRLPMQDLIQEGNIGLLKAVERFDHRRGFRFSTYASWWIRHAISRAIYNKGRQVRLPVHVHDVHQKLTKARRLHLAQHGIEPSIAQLEADTGVPAAKIEKVIHIELGPVMSLDAPSSRNDERAVVDMLEDEESPEPGWQLELDQLHNGLEDALANLRPMEADILRRRYGLQGVKQETLREIGERYALSRERIRQLQERAVGHMRDEFSRMQLL